MSEAIPSFEFVVPTKLAFGQGVANALGERVRALGFGSAFVVVDPGLLNSGMAAPVLASLKSAPVEHSVYSHVKPDPVDLDIEAGAEEFAASPRDCVIGMGGGSAMDTARGVALLATNNGRLRNYDGTDKVGRDVQPLICIPTTAGTGSEVTANIAVTNGD